MAETIHDLPTPTLLLDLDALEHNINVIAGHYETTATKLRPHGKNHKSPWVLEQQINAAGTVGGVCAAKVSEAEVFVDAGLVDNVLIANQVVDAAKIDRLCALADRVDMVVAIDDPEHLERLAAGVRRAGGVRLGVVIEIDTMMRRGGTRTTEAAVALAQAAEANADLTFRGVMSHQVPTIPSPDRHARFEEGLKYIDHVLDVKHAIEAVGIGVDIVSTGESWTYDVAATRSEVTEIEGGTYIVMEVPYDYMTEFRYAARMLGRVISIEDETTALVDIPIDAIGAPNGPPSVWRRSDIQTKSIDHTGLVIETEPGAVAIGDLLQFLPHQQDVMMNRWDEYVGIRGEAVERRIEVAARGCTH